MSDTPNRGILHLVPNTLDSHTTGALPPIEAVLPLGVIRTAARLEHWLVENAKSARAFLKRIDAIESLVRPLQAISVIELPRPQKGAREAAPNFDAPRWLAPTLKGYDMGLLSEAGLPAVADPGASAVEAAHALGVTVIALPGPSALALALAASGHNGQRFAFVGYLPTNEASRAARIRELEELSRRQQQTQLMIETPYRNAALLAALIQHLQGDTRLAVSCGLTLPGGWTRSERVAAWRSRPSQLPSDVPAVFSLDAGVAAAARN